MEQVIKLANPSMVVFALILIGFVLVQVIVFMRRAYAFDKKHNVLTADERRMALTAGGASVIGPAMSVIVIALATIGLFGSGAAFMRMGVIGSDSYEMMLADLAASTLNVKLGTPEVTPAIYCLVLYAMVLGSSPYFINCFFTLRPMERTINKARNVKGSFAAIAGFVANMALLGYFAGQRIAAGMIDIIVMISTALFSWLLIEIADRFKQKWIHGWVLAFSLVVGLTVSIVCKTVFNMK